MSERRRYAVYWVQLLGEDEVPATLHIPRVVNAASPLEAAQNAGASTNGSLVVIPVDEMTRVRAKVRQQTDYTLALGREKDQA